MKQQIPLGVLCARRVTTKSDKLIANASHLRFEIFGRFLARAFPANFLAQSVPVRIQLLQRGVAFSPLRIESQQLIDARFVAAAARGQPFAHKLGPLANQPDVEHAGDLTVPSWFVIRISSFESVTLLCARG